MSSLAVAFVALEHFYILYLEMFLWTTPKGLKVFHQTAEQAEATRVLAANQGLYNGFLGAGLVWGLLIGNVPVQAFFLICVVVAGVYGSITAFTRILYMQAMPAAVGLMLLYLGR